MRGKLIANSKLPTMFSSDEAIFLTAIFYPFFNLQVKKCPTILSIDEEKVVVKQFTELKSFEREHSAYKALGQHALLCYCESISTREFLFCIIVLFFKELEIIACSRVGIICFD